MQRSSLSRTARQIAHRCNGLRPQTCRTAGARWQSVEAGSLWTTPLAKQLAEAITTTGPIPVASYMRQCLTSDLGGYYSNTTATHDQFGAKGDFVTSPEISQIFGELVGIWIVAEWIAQGRKEEGVVLMEMGPGRGTLMDDVLRTVRNFPDLANAVERVVMVESSEDLRGRQHKLLCGENDMVEHELGWASPSKYMDNVQLVWTEDIRLLAKDANHTPFILAHEFFDALPIHVFQSVPPAPASAASDHNTITTPTGTHQTQRRLPQARQQNQWRELLVSPTPSHRQKPGKPEFELSLAIASTPQSLYLPETSPRYKALKSIDGATIEISPEGQHYVADFAERIGGGNTTHAPPQSTSKDRTSSIQKQRQNAFCKRVPSGAALVIDYGPAQTIPANSLRGIRSHQRVSLFDRPGQTDISADVDFLALAQSALNSSPAVEVHGPVSQSLFLTAMGIEQRAAALAKKAVDRERAGSTEKEKGELTEIVKRIESGWKRLVDRNPQGMGRLYNVMAIVPYFSGSSGRRPVGFGGDVGL